MKICLELFRISFHENLLNSCRVVICTDSGSTDGQKAMLARAPQGYEKTENVLKGWQHSDQGS